MRLGREIPPPIHRAPAAPRGIVAHGCAPEQRLAGRHGGVVRPRRRPARAMLAIRLRRARQHDLGRAFLNMGFTGRERL